MPFTDTSDIRIYYQLAGHGQRLLYISGTGNDLRRTPNIFASPLAQAFELLSYDQRGLGQSDKPDRSYSMADYGDDAARLMDALGWESCAVMGTSFGGMAAQEMALRHGDRIDKLVLACTAAGGAGGSSYPLHGIGDMPLEDKLRFRAAINDTRRDVAWQEANPDEFDALIADQLKQQSIGADEPGRVMGAQRQLEARARHDTWDRISALSMPVLVCGGKFDGQAEPAVVAALAGRIPGARLEMFEGGHMFLQQDPNAYPRVIEFLKENS